MARHADGEGGEKDRYRLLPQFVYTDEGLLRGAALFAHMRSYYGGTQREGEQRRGSLPNGAVRDVSEGPRDDVRIDTSGSEALRTDEEPAVETPDAGSDGGPRRRDDGRSRFDEEIFSVIMRHYEDRLADAEEHDDESR